MAAPDPGRWGECGPRPPGRLGARGGQEPGTVLGAVGMMDLAYVCEWEKWAKSTYCPSLPLACAWSCRNLIAFTTDLRNDDQAHTSSTPLTRALETAWPRSVPRSPMLTSTKS
ncbi:thyroid hormone receptor associated protein 5 (predicted), isoform CRA_b [Rattus norvegicus]|uniref:Thyroid hormone receptor associated protein 5 (Predicted), isoform CRA_b n=1 Tax=Rattus norvegicus TaxID=10116 RepID=A6K8V3_RAT|nr:thyroid hormone receptor associated protein 5 (predicted), isoform CRA_b [Rattus norvegicus]